MMRCPIEVNIEETYDSQSNSNLLLPQDKTWEKIGYLRLRR